jgi:hypothetical protein
MDNPGGAIIVSEDDLQRIQALRNGDEAAFTALVEQYYPSMVRIAMIYVPNRAIAEVGTVRGALVPQNVDFYHPDQPRQNPRPA